MTVPVFEYPDKFQQLSFRDWLRQNKPPGSDGYVVEDLDLVLRVYSKAYDTDHIGRFMLCELKFKSAWINHSKRKTFGVMDELLRNADPERKRYAGFFVIQYTDDDWSVSSFRVNKMELNRLQFSQFMDIDPTIIEAIRRHTLINRIRVL